MTTQLNPKRKRELDAEACAAIEKKIEAARNHLRAMLKARAVIEALCTPPVYRCAVCMTNFVTPEDGQDTCDICAGNV
jgi:hypothetical protein